MNTRVPSTSLLSQETLASGLIFLGSPELQFLSPQLCETAGSSDGFSASQYLPSAQFSASPSMPKIGRFPECGQRILCMLVAQSCLTLATPWTVGHQAPPSMGFSRQKYWSGLPFHSPGDLPAPRIKPRSPALQVNSLPAELPGKPRKYWIYLNNFSSSGILTPQVLDVLVAFDVL